MQQIYAFFPVSSKKALPLNIIYGNSDLKHRMIIDHNDGEFYIFFVGRVGDVEVTIVVEGLGVAVAQGLVFAVVAARGELLFGA